MPAATPSSSMFQRRLLLLMGLTVVALLILGGQLGRLTLVHGDELREDAEARLVVRQWQPTTRGKIVDRKGRVLAQNRPSFDLTVDYRVISGEWAIKKAGAAAKRNHASEWPKLAPEERQELIDTYITVYQRHLDAMWDQVAAVTGLTHEELEQRKDKIIERVKAMQRSVYARRLTQELDAKLAKGEEISAEIESDTRKRIERPIADQKAPQVLIANLPDEAAFELMGLVDRKVDLSVPTADGGSVAESLPLLPGLSVPPSGDRDYPCEAMDVEVDLSTLPEPVRAEGKKTIHVEGIAYHLIGQMKEEAQATDAAGRADRLKNDPDFRDRVMTPADARGISSRIDRGQYMDNDPAGKSGIEASREDDLRGLRGLRIQQLDTGEESPIDAIPGRDVHLTIDIALQARVQAAMSADLGLAVAQQWHYTDGAAVNPTVPIGTPLDGAAVVLEVDSGDILAMVSTPSIPRAVLREHPEAIFEDEWNKQVDVPWLNRAIARPYPPGSIAKAVILNGAVKLGKHSLDSHIECNGFLFPDKPGMFRCWAFKQFKTSHTARMGHALSAPEALMVSCNIYFFTLGQRLGAQGVRDTYAMFGLGQPWNLGVGNEFKGEMGVLTDSGGRAPLTIQDAIQMGIGQGPVSWTPLHAADAFTTIARGGVRIRPHVVNEADSPETLDIGLDRRAVKEAMEGLWKSTNEHAGTGHHLSYQNHDVLHFNAPGVVVWGKTGTATAPTLYVEPTLRDPATNRPSNTPNPLWERGVDAAAITAVLKEGQFVAPPNRRVLRWGDHSWFVVLVGTKADNRPRYAIAVMMEYAGSGGKVSGPIVNQIIHALIAEGYLS